MMRLSRKTFTSDILARVITQVVVRRLGVALERESARSEGLYSMLSSMLKSQRVDRAADFYREDARSPSTGRGPYPGKLAIEGSVPQNVFLSNA